MAYELQKKYLNNLQIEDFLILDGKVSDWRIVNINKKGITLMNGKLLVGGLLIKTKDILNYQFGRIVHYA